MPYVMMQEIGDMSVVELKKLLANIRTAIHMRECGYGLQQATPAQVKAQQNRQKVLVMHQ